jgi:hypothetical protein
MTDTIAGFITLGIVFLFMHSFWKSFSDPSKHITLISYLTDFEEKPKSKTYKPRPEAVLKEAHKPKTVTKPKPETKEEPSKQLKEDCNAAMKSIGVDSKQRKYLMTTVFSKYNPKTVEEFLRQAFA